MASSPPAVALLESLPRLSSGPIAWHLVGPAGEVVATSAHEPPRVSGSGDEVSVATLPDARQVVGAADRDGQRAILVFPRAAEAECAPLAAAVLGMIKELDRLEQDLEAMTPAMLPLLEEVSMVNEIMPLLPTADSDREVAEMGLRALFVAASIERAFYLQVDQETGACEAVLQVTMDEANGQPVIVPCSPDPVSVPAEGLIWRALRESSGAILESVPKGGCLGLPGSPESLAKRQAIAAPVRFGDSQRTVELGVLLILDKRANSYSTSLEFGSGETKLVIAVASMLGAVLGSRKVAELGKELEMAKIIQRQILPEEAGKVPGFEIAGVCMTSGAVGGDYFDYLPMADGRQLVVVADVSGHNLASGMLMVSARATLRILAAVNTNVVDVFDDLGAFLHADLNKTERFITAVGATLRPNSAEIEVVSAGHNEAMIYRARTGAIEILGSEGTVLGFLPKPRHAASRIELREGDAMLLYTDGLVEAIDERGEMFGEERLQLAFAKAASKSSKDCLAALVNAVVGFRDRNAHRDDITAVVIRACGREGVRQ